MTFRIALNFEDGATRFIACNTGEKVLDAAYRNKINLPMDCSDGVCGTCKCYCEQGSYDLGDEYIEDALTGEEAEQGFVLTCQMVASSDCVISVPMTSSACKLAPATTDAVLVAAERLSGNRVRLSVKGANGSLPVFLPGQYVNMTIPGLNGIARSYSFSSAPGAEVATFLIRNVENGAMGSYLERAQPGDRLTLHGPLGSFYLREVKRPILMIAGGTGVAPMLSMLGLLAEQGTGGVPVHLIYGAHDPCDLVEVERLEALKARIPDFTFVATCSGESNAHPVKGRVVSHIGADQLNGGDVDVYLCGPPKMVESARHAVGDVASLHFEKFIPAQSAELAA
jgi:benzoate/toluate 1,2-dioxygenase reductase subunit